MISDSPHAGHDIDEDELNAELEALEQEELDKELIGVGPSAHELPEVPSGEVKEPAAEKKKGKLGATTGLYEWQQLIASYNSQRHQNQPKMMMI